LKNKRSLLLVAAFAAVYVLGLDVPGDQIRYRDAATVHDGGLTFLVAGSAPFNLGKTRRITKGLDWSIGEPALSPALSADDRKRRRVFAERVIPSSQAALLVATEPFVDRIA